MRISWCIQLIHTSPGLFSLVSVSLSFSPFLYFWIFRPCNTVGCSTVFHSKLCTSFYGHNFLRCVLWKYFQDMHSITSCCLVSCFCLPRFDSEILDILQYHDCYHKLETFPYVSPHCLFFPFQCESGNYVFLIGLAVLLVSIYIDQQLVGLSWMKSFTSSFTSFLVKFMKWVSFPSGSSVLFWTASQNIDLK